MKKHFGDCFRGFQYFGCHPQVRLLRLRLRLPVEHRLTKYLRKEILEQDCNMDAELQQLLQPLGLPDYNSVEKPQQLQRFAFWISDAFDKSKPLIGHEDVLQLLTVCCDRHREVCLLSLHPMGVPKSLLTWFLNRAKEIFFPVIPTFPCSLNPTYPHSVIPSFHCYIVPSFPPLGTHFLSSNFFKLKHFFKN